MSLLYTSLLIAAVFIIAVTTNRKHLHGALFSILFICVMVASVAVSAGAKAWFQQYGVSSTYTEYQLVVSGYYIATFGLNLMLLYYLNTYETGYKWIAIPISFYAILSLLVPLEFLVLGTESMFRLYNAAPEFVNTIEVLLLAADRYGHRRSGKRFIAHLNANLYHLPISTISNRVR